MKKNKNKTNTYIRYELWECFGGTPAEMVDRFSTYDQAFRDARQIENQGLGYDLMILKSECVYRTAE